MIIENQKQRHLSRRSSQRDEECLGGCLTEREMDPLTRRQGLKSPAGASKGPPYPVHSRIRRVHRPVSPQPRGGTQRSARRPAACRLKTRSSHPGLDSRKARSGSPRAHRHHPTHCRDCAPSTRGGGGCQSCPIRVPPRQSCPGVPPGWPVEGRPAAVANCPHRDHVVARAWSRVCSPLDCR